MNLKEAATELANICVDAESTFEEAMSAAQVVLDLAEPDSDDLDGALRLLLAAVRAEDTERAGIGAIVCGSLVERGGDPTLVTEHIVERFDAVSKTAAKYVDACRQHFEREILSDDAVCEICGPEEDEPDIMMRQVREVVGEAMPEGEAAWVALDLFCRPVVAILSRDDEARREFSNDMKLINRSGMLAQHQPGAYFVWALLSVLEDENLLVVDPAARRAFDVRISGVGDNFQLHILLAHALYGGGHLDGDEPPDPEVVAVVSGEGPPAHDDYVIGYWNLYQWFGLSPEGELPDGYFDQGSRYWIWNEGVPADIQEFEGRRVVMLGPSPYVRQWQPTRLFPELSAKAQVERELEAAEVDELLTAIQEASGPYRESVEG